MDDAADALDADGAALERLGALGERHRVGDPAAAATSLRSTSSTSGLSIRLANASSRWPCAAARRNTGPVPMVKSALPAITALTEPTPTMVRLVTLRPSFL